MVAANRSPRTLAKYMDDATLFSRFLAANGLPTEVRSIDRRAVESFVGDQLARHKPSSAATRYRSVRAFFRWLEEEQEIGANPMQHVRAPTVAEQPIR